MDLNRKADELNRIKDKITKGLTKNKQKILKELATWVE